MKIRVSFEERKENFMDKKVIFTIIQCGHGVYRIITNHMQFRKMNTACITDIDILYDTMKEISTGINNEYGYAVLFEVE